jgi:hypothetical protein
MDANLDLLSARCNVEKAASYKNEVNGNFKKVLD